MDIDGEFEGRGWSSGQRERWRVGSCKRNWRVSIQFHNGAAWHFTLPPSPPRECQETTPKAQDVVELAMVDGDWMHWSGAWTVLYHLSDLVLVVHRRTVLLLGTLYNSQLIIILRAPSWWRWQLTSDSRYKVQGTLTTSISTAASMDSFAYNTNTLRDLTCSWRNTFSIQGR